MIEAVDPNDAGALDEIDARVFCYLSGTPFSGLWNYGFMRSFESGRIDYFRWIDFYNGPNDDEMDVRYTRSRDALKKIRPEGWSVESISHYGHLTYRSFWKVQINETLKGVASPALPTEELAELHAIIQAIEYERNNAQTP
jgi:hypothetical protein